MLEKAKILPQEAEEAKSCAANDFNALDMMKKGKALMATGQNLKLTAKIPVFVTEAINKVKTDLLEL